MHISHLLVPHHVGGGPAANHTATAIHLTLPEASERADVPVLLPEVRLDLHVFFLLCVL